MAASAPKVRRGGSWKTKRASPGTSSAAARRAQAIRHPARSATVRRRPWRPPQRQLRSSAGASPRCRSRDIGSGTTGSWRRLRTGMGSGESGCGGWVWVGVLGWRCGGLAARGAPGTAADFSASPFCRDTEVASTNSSVGCLHHRFPHLGR